MTGTQLLGAALIIIPVMALVVAAGVAMSDDLGKRSTIAIWLAAVAIVLSIVAGAQLLGGQL